MKRTTLALFSIPISILAGCEGASAPGPTALRVQSLSISGDIDGQSFGDADLSDATIVALQDGDVGRFMFAGRALEVHLSACPLGSLATDPYGGGDGGIFDPFADGGSVPPFEGPIDDGGLPSVCTEDTDADVRCVPVDPQPIEARSASTVSGASCEAAGLFVCADGRCATFLAGDLALQIVEESGGRFVVADGSSAHGRAHVELHYREGR